ETLVEEFAQGARRLKEAGFDAVEIHGAHGYLICQFLSGYANQRQDKYGGDLPRRSRFAVEVVARTREVVGTGFPIVFRLSADEYVPGGLTLDETKVIARLLEEAGVDALSVSAGNYDSFEWVVQPMIMPRGALLPLAQGIKQAVHVPVIAAGRLNDVKLAEKVLEEGKADFVGMGRPLLADPDLPVKALQGRERQTIRCIACNTCQDEIIRARSITCLVNPEAGREGQAEVRAARSKRVRVIGGGAAGLEAARVAALRGHRVSLWDESPRLGGRWSWLIRPYLDQQVRALRSLGVELKLGEAITPERVVAFHPDAVVVTTGGKPRTGIRGQGMDRARVLHADDVLEEKAQPEGAVVVLGGGNIGCETAEFLRRHGSLATIVEGSWRIGYGLEREIRNVTAANLRRHGVTIMASTAVVRADAQGLTVRESEGKETYLRADSVILALGHEPRSALAASLRGRGLEVFEVDYCESPRHAFGAAREGAEAARSL
ncbi:MAG: FAD-dependent oxidoreductase, partial [Chloroflexota bacterium]|nr:FAD-dependent oxidoreductase [Chloroflexota bacterium]